MSKPRINDLLKANKGKPYTFHIQNVGGEGRPFNGQYGISWAYDCIMDRKEYTYFINSENHHRDFENITKKGNRTVTVTAVDYYDESRGKSITMYDVQPAEEQKQAPGAVDITKQIHPQPKWANDTVKNLHELDKIVLGDRNECRHAYTLEVFKWLLNRGEKLELTPEMSACINKWVKYSTEGVDKEPQKPVQAAIHAPLEAEMDEIMRQL